MQSHQSEKSSKQVYGDLPPMERALSNKNQFEAYDEIDLFDLFAIFVKRWHWVLGFLFTGTAAAFIATLVRTPRYELSIPLELPSEATYNQFNLPKLIIGEGDSLSLEESNGFNQDIVLRALNNNLTNPLFQKKWHSDGSIESSTLEIKDIAGKASSTLHLTARNPDLLSQKSQQLPLDLVSLVNTEIQEQLKQKLMDRIELASQTKIRLRQSALESLQNKIALKQNEIEIERRTLIDKIAALEKEATLERLNAMEALKEKRETQQLEIERRLKALHSLASAQRQDRITQLEEAAKIAEQIESSGDRSNDKLINSKNYAATEGKYEPLYLRGKSALLAEINQLKQQTNDSIIIPEIRDLENGLDLIQSDVKYEILNARKNDAKFSSEIPALKSQLEFLDRNGELDSLKRLASKQQSIDPFIKELPLLDGDILRTNRLLTALPKLVVLKFQSIDRVPISSEANKRWLIVLAGACVSLFLGVIAAFIAERWSLRKAAEFA